MDEVKSYVVRIQQVLTYELEIESALSKEDAMGQARYKLEFLPDLLPEPLVEEMEMKVIYVSQ